MALRCNICHDDNGLAIVAKIEIPPDNRSDEISLQIIQCVNCGFQGVAIYEESRRGNLENESWNYDGFPIQRGEFNYLYRLIQSCPAPNNHRCNCKAHQILAAQDISGNWIGLNSFFRGDRFSLG